MYRDGSNTTCYFYVIEFLVRLYFTVVACLKKNRASGKTSGNEAGLLTPALVHAPGLRPDLEGVRFLLERPIGCRGVKGGQDGQRLGGRRRHRRRAPQGVRGHDGHRAAGASWCVCCGDCIYCAESCPDCPSFPTAERHRDIQVKAIHTLKNKHDLMLCQSRLHAASETFIRHKKIQIKIDFLRFSHLWQAFWEVFWQFRATGYKRMPKSRMAFVKLIHFVSQHKALYVDPCTLSSQKLVVFFLISCSSIISKASNWANNILK